MMKYILLVVSIFLLCFNVMGHNPLTAKIELKATNERGAVLGIYLSQTGLHQALIKKYDEVDFESMAVHDYKELIVKYMKEHVELKADKQPLTIGEGGISLGNHQTDLKFFIDNYPGQTRSLDIHINAFEENDNHHTVFWWKRPDGKSKVILSKKANDFRAILTEGSGDSMYAIVETGNNVWYLIVGVFLFFAGILFVRFR
ncbi:MAG: hypothetical protein HKO89_00470 [Saprospiraceae bacterium]|nr:hypothetical protein [Bacteroidia bacterium]NNK89058.1 hypothetical protein [Saprospiraceae bacterium]